MKEAYATVNTSWSDVQIASAMDVKALLPKLKQALAKFSVGENPPMAVDVTEFFDEVPLYLDGTWTQVTIN